MILTACILSSLILGTPSQPKIPVRFEILHADPYLIKAFLEGRPALAPEISTTLAMGGSLLLGAAQAAAIFQKGYWFVNPTDNSLWLVPDN